MAQPPARPPHSPRPSRLPRHTVLAFGLPVLLCAALTACGEVTPQDQARSQAQTQDSPTTCRAKDHLGGEAARAPRSTASSPAPGMPGTVRPQPHDLPGKVAEHARRHHADVFTGVYREGDTVVVSRIPEPGSSIESDLEREFPAAELKFNDTPFTEAELNEVTQRILKDESWQEREGVGIAWFGPDVKRGVVEINIVDSPDRFCAKLARRYGPSVEVTGPVARPVPAVGPAEPYAPTLQ